MATGVQINILLLGIYVDCWLEWYLKTIDMLHSFDPSGRNVGTRRQRLVDRNANEFTLLSECNDAFFFFFSTSSSFHEDKTLTDCLKEQHFFSFSSLNPHVNRQGLPQSSKISVPGAVQIAVSAPFSLGDDSDCSNFVRQDDVAEKGSDVNRKNDLTKFTL